jgi:hypothetical protein
MTPSLTALVSVNALYTSKHVVAVLISAIALSSKSTPFIEEVTHTPSPANTVFVPSSLLQHIPEKQQHYLKAIPELTILPENQQHLQITKQEARIS